MNTLCSYFLRWMDQKNHLLLATFWKRCFLSKKFPLLRYRIHVAGCFDGSNVKEVIFIDFCQEQYLCNISRFYISRTSIK